MGRPSQREQILVAASRLFRAQGYHATTIREIADEIGILSGSLYAHIQSKEDLLYEIVDEGATAFLTSIREIVESPLHPIDKLQAALTAHIQVIADHADASTVFFHEWQLLSDTRRAQIQEKRDLYEAYWTLLIEEGMNAGMFEVGDVKFVRLTILSVANWAYQWYRADGELEPDVIAKRFMEVISHGLLSRRDGEEEVQ